MKKSFLLVVILCIGMLTGCKMGVDLDSKENDLIAEYAAGVVLLHSHYYQDRYEKPWTYQEETESPTEDYEEPTIEEPTVEKPTSGEPSTEKPTTDNPGQNESETSEKPTSDGEKPTTDGENPTGGEKPTGEQPTGNGEGGNGEKPTEEPVELNLTEAFGTHPVEVKYVDYTVCDSIDVDPDGFFEILPDKGCSFLVLNFTLNNRSFVRQTVNTADDGIIIRLTINEEDKYNNYDASMLMNDLTVLSNVTLESKEEYPVVIVYMIPTEEVDNIESMYIEVASDMEMKGQYVLK